MNLAAVEIAGFRSIRNIYLPLRRLTVLVGANGVGKTNLYRSLELLHSAATGTMADAIAREGGLGSIHFAGERKTHEKPRLRLSAKLEGILETEQHVSFETELGFPILYENELGFREAGAASFRTEAQVKSETLVLKQGKRSVTLMERDGPAVWARDNGGRRVLVNTDLLASETVLSTLRGGFPEIDAVRHAMAGWRFYHGFRTDTGSPLRRPSAAITSPTLNASGDNLAAVFATLRHIREDSIDLDAAIDRAFPGARLHVPAPDTDAQFAMYFPDMPKRAFGAHELSDGTLHFLALMGALLSYRLPHFVALNEPEASLHPSLLPALAQTIAKAAERSQIWVVTHSRELAAEIADLTGITPREVIRREDGATWLEGLSQAGTFPDDED